VDGIPDAPRLIYLVAAITRVRSDQRSADQRFRRRGQPGRFDIVRHPFGIPAQEKFRQGTALLRDRVGRRVTVFVLQGKRPHNATTVNSEEDNVSVSGSPAVIRRRLGVVDNPNREDNLSPGNDSFIRFSRNCVYVIVVVVVVVKT